MLRRTLGLAVLAAAATLSVGAQPTPKNYLEIPPTPGRPFTATAVVELERYDEEDVDPVSRTLSLIARDAKGRTHNEVRRLMPESFHGTPQILVVRIFDPETLMEVTYDPVRHAGTRQIRPDSPKPFLSGAGVKTQNLGTSTMDGLQTKGVRHWAVISTGAAWWKKSAQVEEEVWTSEDLHLSLLLKRSDERSGSLTVGISNLKREEPPASMFEVPAGIKVQDLPAADGTMPTSASAGQAGKP